jgi:hypothetical protein
MNGLRLEELKSTLSYDAATGVFVRLSTVNPNPRAQIGRQAGGHDSRGYRVIRVKYRKYMAHRLAWFYAHGLWPDGDIDHINGEVDDNRIENLRVATRSQNMANAKTPVTNKSGVKGVFERADGRFLANMTVQKKTVYVGIFDTKEAASAARQSAFVASFGVFARA